MLSEIIVDSRATSAGIPQRITCRGVRSDKYRSSLGLLARRRPGSLGRLPTPSQATGRDKRRDNHLQMLRIAPALVVDLCCAKLSKGAERLDHRLLCQYPVNHSRRLRSASWRGFLRLSPVSCPDLPLCSDDAHEIHPPAPKSRSRFQQV